MSKKKHKKGKHHGRGEDGGLPSMLREAGAMLLAKADTPEGREAIASGLALAAAAASAAASRARQEAQTARVQTVQPVADPSDDGGAERKATDPQPPPVMEALSAAAGAFMNRLMERKA